MRRGGYEILVTVEMCCILAASDGVSCHHQVPGAGGRDARFLTASLLVLQGIFWIISDKALYELLLGNVTHIVINKHTMRLPVCDVTPPLLLLPILAAPELVLKWLVDSPQA